MDFQDDVLQSVNLIISRLQIGKWGDLDEPLLLSSQGKLAVYQSNVACMVADANQEQLTLELLAKNREAEKYLAIRQEGKTCEDAKMIARLDAEFNNKQYFESKKTYERLRGVLNAIETLITAIQVQLRATHREESRTKFQNV